MPAAPSKVNLLAPRVRLARASGWLAWSYVALAVTAATSVLASVAPRLPAWHGVILLAFAVLWCGVTLFVSGASLAFLLATARVGAGASRLFAALGVLGVGASCLGVYGLIFGLPGFASSFSMVPLGATVLPIGTDLALASLLREVGARRKAWTAAALGVAWMVVLVSVWAARAWAERSLGPLIVFQAGAAAAFLVFCAQCTVGPWLLFSARLSLLTTPAHAASTLKPAEPGNRTAGALVMLGLAVVLAIAPVGLLAAQHVESCETRLVMEPAPADWRAWPVVAEGLEGATFDRLYRARGFAAKFARRRGQDGHLGPFAISHESPYSKGPTTYTNVRLFDPVRCRSSKLELDQWFGEPGHAHYRSPTQLRLREAPGERFAITGLESAPGSAPEQLLLSFKREPWRGLLFGEAWVGAAIGSELLLLLPLAMLLVRCVQSLVAAWRVFGRRGLLTYADAELLPNDLVQLADGSATLRCRLAGIRPGPVLVSPEFVAGALRPSPGPFRSLPEGARGIVGASREEVSARGREALARAQRLSRTCVAVSVAAALLFTPLLFW